MYLSTDICHYIFIYLYFTLNSYIIHIYITHCLGSMERSSLQRIPDNPSLQNPPNALVAIS